MVVKYYRYYFFNTTQNDWRNEMEKKTVFVHSTNPSIKNNQNNEYRIVTFIGGNKNILDIIKELIKNKY